MNAAAGSIEPSARHHYRVLDSQHVSPAVREAAAGALRWAGEVTSRDPCSYAIEWFEGVYHPAAIRDLEERRLPGDPEGDRAFARPHGLNGVFRVAAPRVLRVRAALSPRGAARVAVHELAHAVQLEEHPDVYRFPEAEPVLERQARDLEALLERSDFYQALPSDEEGRVERDRHGKLRDLVGYVREDLAEGLERLMRARETVQVLREVPAELLAAAGVDLAPFQEGAVADLLEAAARCKGGEHVEAGTGK